MGKGCGFGTKEDVLKCEGRQQSISGAVWASPCCSRGGEGWAGGLAGRAVWSFRLEGTSGVFWSASPTARAEPCGVRADIPHGINPVVVAAFG